MKYDFTTLPDRSGKDALALDSLGTPRRPGRPMEGFDAIPMWIADMNFATAPSVMESIAERAAHPCFGYFSKPPEYFDSIALWQRERNGVQGLLPEHIGYENGVLGGVCTALRVFCSPGDSVIIHSPTYVGFTQVLNNCGYRPVLSPLKPDSEGIWRMDFEDMEASLSKGNIHAAIFCSPHNPCGRVWERQEIEAAMELFRKYDVPVISDEIWSDIIMPGYRHIPTQSVSEDAAQRTVALYSPSKTFNLAGLVGSYHIIYNHAIKSRVDKESSITHYNSMNLLSIKAHLGAYCREGMEWTDQLNEVLSRNVDLFCGYLEKEVKGVFLSRPQGTYMVFADLTEYCSSTGKSLDQVLKACWDCGVALQDGRPFHGSCHTRVNLALPTARVEEAVNRLRKYVFV